MSTDNLDGFRGRDTDLTPDEEILEAVHGLRANDIDRGTIRDYVKSQEIREALIENTPFMELVAHCVRVIEGTTYLWTAADDPMTNEMKELHGRARAARMVMAWIEQVLSSGKVAEQSLDQQEAEEHG